MKKNIAMRVAAFLFILTMISTCAFATTFAKYVSSDSANDSARVAKWGVTVDVATATNGMFHSAYSNGADDTVVGESSAKVVAPGTKVDNAVVVTVKGNPEVAVSLQYEVEFALTGWDAYCPLVITVNNVKYYVGATINGEKIANAAALVTKVKGAIETLSTTFDAGKDLTTEKTDDLNVSWEWLFDDTAADFATNYPGLVLDDVKDTALGDAATAPTISLKVTCTVTQID